VPLMAEGAFYSATTTSPMLAGLSMGRQPGTAGWSHLYSGR